MQKAEKREAKSLTMVEVDHNRFAAEILNGNARINLTQMAKPFGESKKPSKWLRAEEAKEYLDVLSVGLKCPAADLVEVRQGGTPEEQGTWCNDYRIALRFAQWLSAEFSVACDDALFRLVYGKAVSLAAEEIDYKGERVVDARDKETEWVELLGTEVKSVEIGGERWYSLADVSRAVGNKKTCKTKSLNDKRPLARKVLTFGSSAAAWYVGELGVRLLVSSRKTKVSGQLLLDFKEGGIC